MRYKLIQKSPGGVVCPIVTPLDSRGRVNARALHSLINAIIDDVDGIFVLGTSGEFPSLTESQKAEVASLAIEAVAGRCTLYVGAGESSTPRTLERIRMLSESEIDYIVVTSPYYFSPTAEALERHFLESTTEADKPIILYNIPQNTHVSIDPSLVGMLSEHPKIAGIKDSSGDPFLFSRYLHSASDGFVVMQGREQLMLASYIAGARGVVSSLANFAPKLLSALQAGFAASEPLEALKLCQARINEVATVFDNGHWLPALKTALVLRGYNVGDPIHPTAPSNREEFATIEGVLARNESELISRAA